MTEKQPDWIDNIMTDFRILRKIHKIENWYILEQEVREIIKKHLSQASYCSNTQESTYESGYQKGREDMKREIREKIDADLWYIDYENQESKYWDDEDNWIDSALRRIKDVLSPTK